MLFEQSHEIKGFKDGNYMLMEPFHYKVNAICSRCIMDDSVKEISFNEKGECTFCEIHDELEIKFSLGREATEQLGKIVEKIKKEGRGKRYDCIVGISGGKDSSYTLVKVVELGLRPLAVHFDNGWNSELAVSNIEKICTKLDVDLYTHVANWEEFRDLQKAFLLASVPDGEVPTDWSITSVLYTIANKLGVKTIIGGNTFRTEGTTPLSWTYQDPKYIKAIHKQFGSKKIKSFPIMSAFKFLYYSLIKQIRWVRILYYLPYNENNAVQHLKDHYGWRNYDGKHFESTYTRFFQSYILTKKFNIDKRKLHFSAKIRSGQLTREEALLQIREDPFKDGWEAIAYNLKKLQLTPEEFEEIMKREIKSFKDYPNYYNFIQALKRPLVFLSARKVVPDAVIKKYFKL
jgi:N-acetyl sugar amidotransferase